MEPKLDANQIERFKAYLKATDSDTYDYRGLRDAIRYVLGKGIPYSDSRKIIEWLDVNRCIEIDRQRRNFSDRLWRIVE
jgi:hypothetical protein